MSGRSFILLAVAFSVPWPLSLGRCWEDLEVLELALARSIRLRHRCWLSNSTCIRPENDPPRRGSVSGHDR